MNSGKGVCERQGSSFKIPSEGHYQEARRPESRVSAALP